MMEAQRITWPVLRMLQPHQRAQRHVEAHQTLQKGMISSVDPTCRFERCTQGVKK